MKDRKVDTVEDVWALCDEAGLPRWPAAGPSSPKLFEFGRALKQLLDEHDELIDELKGEVQDLQAELTRTRATLAGEDGW